MSSSKPFRIYQDIYLIGSAEISHPYDCCVYLIDVGELILIDSGAGQSFDRLVDNIGTLGLIPEKITTVIVTHCHIDHVGSLAEFKQKYGAKIMAHELDAEAIETGEGVGAEAYGWIISLARWMLSCRERNKSWFSGGRSSLLSIFPVIPGEASPCIPIWVVERFSLDRIYTDPIVLCGEESLRRRLLPCKS
jgi:glyoxylase-like metal-dependent hydrolase (beta-lactamase superfamily II)